MAVLGTPPINPSSAKDLQRFPGAAVGGNQDLIGLQKVAEVTHDHQERSVQSAPLENRRRGLCARPQGLTFDHLIPGLTNAALNGDHCPEWAENWRARHRNPRKASVPTNHSNNKPAAEPLRLGKIGANHRQVVRVDDLLDESGLLVEI